MAKVLGLTAARVNQLIDEGIIVRDESSRAGRIFLFDSLQNYFLSKKATGDGVNYWKEKALHEKISRQRDELKLSKEQGAVYDAAEVESFIAEIIAQASIRLLGLGHKVAPRFEESAKICAAIDDEVTEILKELARNAAEYQEAVEAVEPAPES